ncbi:MAG: DUF6288 domain-containing protein, partial [Luteolibacter sp.]
LSDGSGRLVSTGYGPVNSVGIVANMAIFLGKKALQSGGRAIDPMIDTAIQRGSDYFASYVNKGSIPYGEETPEMNNFASNGKDPMCAVFYSLQTNRAVETEYFTRMTTASFNGRERGHSGQAFSYLWGALGANVGGSEAVAEYMNQVRWFYDLQRRTDGSFAYCGGNEFGPGSTADGTYLGKDEHYLLNTTAIYLLNYSLPFKRLFITGKDSIPANTLDSTKVAHAISSATFKQSRPGLTNAQLTTALSDYLPQVRRYAAIELGNRSLNSTELTTLRGMVTGTDANGRMGACEALGLLQDTAALPLLVARLDKIVETDSWVRAKAAQAIGNYPSGTASVHRDSLLATFTANAPNPDVIDWAGRDPLQLSNGYLGSVLFGNLASYTINADKNSLLYPALKIGIQQANSMARWSPADFCQVQLPTADVQAIIPDILDLTQYDSLNGRITISQPRAAGFNTLAKHQIREGVALALAAMDVPAGFTWGSFNYLNPAVDALESYGDAARWTLPALNGYLATWNPQDYSYPALVYSNLVSAVAGIENAITAPTQNLGLAVANSQVHATTGPKAVTLSGTSPRPGVTFTYSNVTVPAHGTLTGVPPNITYTPAGGYTGPDHFTFQVSDGLTISEPGTVSIIVGTAGTGLKGEYYDNANFTNLKLTRTDAQVNFDWGTASPNALLGADTFSVRWSGLLLVPETGSYKFSALNSDGVRLYVNGVLVINDYSDQTTNWNDGSSVNLTAGQMVELHMEYYENTGDAVAKLKWTGPSFAGLNGAIIGSQWLFDGTGMTRTPYAFAQSLTLLKNMSQDLTLSGSGGTLTYTVITPPANGTLTGTAPNLTYTPTANYNGSDSFTFKVNNGTSDSAPATVAITVAAPSKVWNVNIGDNISPSDNFIGAASENTANSTWNSVTTNP